MQVRGIATIDRQPDSDKIAVWVTSASGGVAAHHANAVVMDPTDDPDTAQKVRSLTRCCAVLVTEGSVLDGLPVEGAPLTPADIAALVAETESHQQVILDAISDWKRQGGSKAHPLPTFAPSPDPSDFKATEDDAGQRAFVTANYLSRAWTGWLRTDEERRRRTLRPKTGERGWIMPDELGDPALATFPSGLAAKVRVQSMV